MSQIKTEILTITPSEAQRMLEGNTNNRKLSKHRVAELAAAIKAGSWVMNGESIKFNGKHLLDGQHRLHAVVEAGKPIKTLVVRGLDSRIFTTLDQQKKRSAIDVLHISGEEHTKILASAITLVMDIRAGGQWMRGKSRGTNQAFIDFMKKEPEIRESVSFVSHKQGMLTKLGGFAIPTALHYLFSLADKSKADEFMEDLHSGIVHGTNDPVYLLRQRLIANAATRIKMERTFMCALFIKAWNARFAGETMHRLIWNPSREDFPTIRTDLK